MPLGARRRDEEIEHAGLAARVDEHVAARAEAGERALGHARRHHRRDRGVDRVAAVAQDLRPRLGGQRMAAGDNATGGHRAV